MRTFRDETTIGWVGGVAACAAGVAWLLGRDVAAAALGLVWVATLLLRRASPPRGGGDTRTDGVPGDAPHTPWS